MNRNAYQAIPSQGRLTRNLNLSLEALSERIAPFQQNTVYFYVVSTVKRRKGRLYQKGSGPNFQGGLLTLCSCKHYMRALRDVESWRGVWIAGYTSRTHSGNRKLFYLMMVSQVFESHRAFWLSDSIPEETKLAKAAHQNRLGDVYQPRNESGDPHSHKSYFRPCKNHVHRESEIWHDDIDYVDQYGRRPALLVGSPEHSFLWDKPMIRLPSAFSGLRRRHKKKKLSDLFPLD